MTGIPFTRREIEQVHKPCRDEKGRPFFILLCSQWPPGALMPFLWCTESHEPPIGGLQEDASATRHLSSMRKERDAFHSGRSRKRAAVLALSKADSEVCYGLFPDTFVWPPRDRESVICVCCSSWDMHARCCVVDVRCFRFSIIFIFLFY